MKKKRKINLQISKNNKYYKTKIKKRMKKMKIKKKMIKQ